MEIKRYLQDEILKNLDKQKVSLLLGARRVGKTILLEKIHQQNISRSVWLNGEDRDTQLLLDSKSVASYKRLIGKSTLLIIDEAQNIPDISSKAKLMIDNIKPLHIILTGSSAFHLHQMSQPLTGRVLTNFLFPMAQMELIGSENLLVTKQILNTRLVYGSYPELFHLETEKEKQEYLLDIVEYYLLRDILAFENIKNPQKIKDLLILIAHQAGHEVSLEELGRNLHLSKNTVERYLDLLSKVFVLYKHSGYSNNLRKEITKSSRWYFIDNGIRNAVLNDFSPVELRKDIGMLWENYFISERKKYNSYTGNRVNSYFWRTYDQQEIDLIEEKNGKIVAFECKWTKNKTKTPIAFSKAYSKAEFHVVNRENYLEWITQS